MWVDRMVNTADVSDGWGGLEGQARGSAATYWKPDNRES